MAGKFLLLAVMALAWAFSGAAFAQRPPSLVLPGDIEEYQRECLQLRQTVGAMVAADWARAGYQLGWEEAADHRNDDPNGNQGPVERYWTHNRLSAAELSTTNADGRYNHVPFRFMMGHEKYQLFACAIRVRVEQLRRPLPQSAPRPSPSATVDQNEAEIRATPPDQQRRRPRGDPPTIIARVVRHAGETRCINVNALGTEWTNPVDEEDRGMTTTIEFNFEGCEREQVFEALVDPWPFGPGSGQSRPNLTGVQGWHYWCGRGHNSQSATMLGCVADIPVEWRPFYPSQQGLRRSPGMPVTTEVWQRAGNHSPVIEVQIASCNATQDGPNGTQVKVMIVELHLPPDGFNRIACPVLPDTAFTDEDRGTLSRAFNIPPPPPNEHPQMTRCMNRDGALSLSTAEASCRNLAEDPGASRTLRSYALYNWARARLIAGNLSEAVEVGNRALALQPTASTHHNLGLAHMRRRDYAAAAGHLQAALRIDSQRSNTQRFLNRVNLLLDNPTLQHTWEAHETRRRMISAGITRIESYRSRCTAEAEALPASAANGKSLNLSAAKLERLIAVYAVDSTETRRERADQLREAETGLTQAARNYMACLIDEPASRPGAQRAASDPASQPRSSAAPRVERIRAAHRGDTFTVFELTCVRSMRECHARASEFASSLSSCVDPEVRDREGLLLQPYDAAIPSVWIVCHHPLAEP